VKWAEGPSRPFSSVVAMDYVRAARERVVVYDGSMGVALLNAGLSVDDYGGPQFEGCPDILNVTRPDVVADLHRQYLEVGVDAIETNAFGAFAVPLGEYGIPERAYEIARAGAEIAREVASGYATPDRPRWVAGNLGPGTKMPSLGHIRFADLRDAYEEEARGLLDGGVDLLLVETMYDPLAAKAALVG